MNWGLLILTAIVGYLVGATPMAYLICKAKGINIFEIGSGNMGATNVARALGPRYFVLTWFLDGGKGIVAILVGYLFFARDADARLTGAVVGAIAAVIGHSWSIFILYITGKLGGGKGGAVASGAWLVMSPIVAVLTVVFVFVPIFWRTRIMSLSVLATTSAATVWMLIRVAQEIDHPIMAVYAIALCVLIYIRHRENIGRLLQGSERRFGGSG